MRAGRVPAEAPFEVNGLRDRAWRGVLLAIDKPLSLAAAGRRLAGFLRTAWQASLSLEFLEVNVANKTWKFSQRAVVAAVSLLLGTAAQAGLVRGELDPPATLNIPAYNGFADFQVADNCLVGDGWKPTGNASGSCGSVFMQSATINLYGSNQFDPPTGPVQGTLNFGAYPDTDVFGILTQGGQVLGIDSSAMGFATANGPGNFNSYWLQFVTGCNQNPSCGQPLLITVQNIADFPSADPLAYLYENGCEGDACFPVNNPSRTAPGGLTFTAVPEPGTMGLILGALGGGWLARRRKKKTTA